MISQPGRPDKLTLLVFLLLVVQGGSNAVAVRLSNQEMAPFWGAAFRFLLAAVIFWLIVLIWRIPIPQGRALRGAAVYGAFNIGLFFALMYWALLNVTASMAMVVLALTPLLTFFFAWGHGLEAFRWRGLLGALMAFGGIVIAVGDQLGSTLALLPLVAITGAAAATAEGSVIYKSYPKGDPLAVNAVALSVGTLLILLISLLAGEVRTLPQTQSTWVVLVYLVLAGSLALPYMYLFVLDRWTASATSYSFLLFPVATVVIAAWLLGEIITPRFLLGGVVVLLGVYFGALAKTPAVES